VSDRESEDFGTILTTLRAVRGWKQQDLAAVAGLWSSTISDFELGKKSPQAQTLAKLLGAFGLSGHWLEPLSLLFRALRTVMESQGAPPAGEALAGMEAWAGQAGKALEEFLLPVLALLQSDLAATLAAEPRQKAPPSSGASSAGPALWARLEPYTLAQQRAAVRELEEFQSWPLSEFLSFASASLARDSASLAVELADLACRVAELGPGAEAPVVTWGTPFGFRATCRRPERRSTAASPIWRRGRRRPPPGSTRCACSISKPLSVETSGD